MSEAISNKEQAGSSAIFLALHSFRSREGVRWGALTKSGLSLSREYPNFESFRSLALFEQALSDQAIDLAYAQIDKLAGVGVKVIALSDSNYPPMLRQIYDPPPVLFCRGKISLDEKLPIGVVGSRSSDRASIEVAQSVSKDLVLAGAIIISGLALGIDTAAHRGALSSQVHSPTIAVLGTAIDKIYPAANRDLAQQIIESGGGLISEYPPGSKTYPSNFLERDRVISGISQAVLVIQAAKSSGSLVTARYAMEEGRDVYVWPGFGGDERFEGSHRLIRSGATLVTEVGDIIEEYPNLLRSKKSSSPKDTKELSPNQSKVFESVPSGVEISVENIVAVAGTEIHVEHELITLELLGYLERLPGGLVRRCSSLDS